MSVRILTGDVRDVLPSLDAGSVQLTICSPPYFALRDYQTATWEGGEPACDHVQRKQTLNKDFNERWGQGSGQRKQEQTRVSQYRDNCEKCGARRVDRQIGSEPTPDEFVATMVGVFREVRRVLRDDGCLVLNLGDSYAGSGKGPTGHNGIGNQGERQGFTNAPKQRGTAIRPKTESGFGNLGATSMRGFDGVPAKSLLMIPFRVALALQADGWILRSVIPWVKRNPMPESVTDRPATAIEYLFLFSKRAKYFWDGEAIRRANTPGTLVRHSGPPEPPFQDARCLGIHGDRAHQGKLNVNGGWSNGRSFRNSDPFFDSWQGLLLDEWDDPMALVVNPEASNFDCCLGCGFFAEGSGRPKRRTVAGKRVLTCPSCGATDRWADHYAMFPGRLVEPFVRACTSEKGACARCGAPYRRVVERTATPKDRPTGKGWQDGITSQDCWASGTPTHSGLANGTYQRGQTVGWQPGCSCPPADPVPQVVLDPFLGSGTTALVADRLGRSCVGIELNPDYVRLARRRLESDAPLLTAGAVEAPEAAEQLALLGEGVGA